MATADPFAELEDPPAPVGRLRVGTGRLDGFDGTWHGVLVAHLDGVVYFVEPRRDRGGRLEPIRDTVARLVDRAEDAGHEIEPAP